jgi:hypothetical protein
VAEPNRYAEAHNLANLLRRFGDDYYGAIEFGDRTDPFVADAEVRARELVEADRRSQAVPDA